jgi:putative endonuclease
MTDKQKTGEIGEALAATHLARLGLEIVARSYRYKRVEVDLIAKRADGCLIFVEVKTRRGLQWGHPSAAVSITKERNIAKAASAYMREVNHDWEVRFDIVAILLYKDGTHTLEHLVDAFFPGMF